MRLDRRVRNGVMLGLLLAGAALVTEPWWGPLVSAQLPAHGPIVSETHGAIAEVAIQYIPESAPVVTATYRELLQQLSPDVRVLALCPSREAFADLCARVGGKPCRLTPVIVGHPITFWARDRWLAFTPLAHSSSVTLWSPSSEEGEEVWPARAGDRRVADDLALAFPGQIVSARSRLRFDGGDFVTDDETVFVTPRVRRSNVPSHLPDAAALQSELEHVLRRRVVLLDDAPDHHAAMFMMLVGERRALVGDPSLARALVASAAAAPADAGIAATITVPPDLSAATQARFDAVARQVAASGYSVVRVPVIPGMDGRTFITPLNVILDERDGHRIVFMPTARGAEALTAAAAAIWTALGFEVRRVDTTAPFASFGGLHCLVNVLKRADRR